MTGQSKNLRLTEREVAAAFADGSWSERFPPVLTVEQAAELAGVPRATIYAWSSQGQLQDCARRVGKHLRIFRDRFLKRLFNEGLPNGT